MIFNLYKCCQCKTDIDPSKAFPQEDDEFQFCSNKCHDDYVKENKEEPNYVIRNIVC